MTAIMHHRHLSITSARTSRKQNVFNVRIKTPLLMGSHSSTGSEFQTVGPRQRIKARRPSVLRHDTARNDQAVQVG